MTREDIARVAHEVNRTYCQAYGDESQLPWSEAPEWQKISAINGVNYHLDNPEAKPSHSHESWMAEKVANGWVLGLVKDPDKKEHPDLLPYEQLPSYSRVKDYLFTTVVNQLKTFLVFPN